MHRNGLLNDYPCGVPAVFFCQRELNPYIFELSNINVFNSDPGKHQNCRFENNESLIFFINISVICILKLICWSHILKNGLNCT